MQYGQHRTIAGGLWGGDLLLLDTLPSTNTWTREQARNLKHGDVVRAIRQTAGKGRFDREWVAPGRCNLNLSVLVKPHEDDTLPAALLLPTTAIALRDTLDEFGIAADLKWPNDVLVNDRKIAGILAETDSDTGLLILGTGLNVNITAPALAGMPFQQPPTSMAVERERFFDIDAICRRYLIDMEKVIDAARRDGPGYIAARWKEADALAGKTIAIDTGETTVTGQYAGMQKDGRLAIIAADNVKHLFWSGDVSVVSGIL